MEEMDIRWKQRFQNFEKALKLLEVALQIEEPDMLQKAGIIHFFEMGYELAWNTLKDLLEAQGFTEIRSPRSTFKKAFEIGLIKEGHTWMELLNDRNLTAHTYDEVKATDVEKLIHHKYFPILKSLCDTLKEIESNE